MLSPDFLLESDRLILRPFTMDDVDAAHEMNLDAEVSRFTADGGVVSLDETRRRIKEDLIGDYNKHGFGRFAVIHKLDNKFIGFAGLKFHPDLNLTDLGYRFISRYWGSGYATEAARLSIKFGFETQKLNQIIAWVLPENQASVRVLEKLGFQLEKEFMEEGHLVLQFKIINPKKE